MYYPHDAKNLIYTLGSFEIGSFVTIFLLGCTLNIQL